MNATRPSGGRRLALAAGALLIAVVGATAASYTDVALLGMGTGTTNAVGNPNLFDIAVLDADGVWQDANSEAGAVVLPLDGDATLSADAPVTFTVTLLNRDPGVAGILILSLYDPDPTGDDLFDALRFTVAVDGSKVASDVSADGFNASKITIADVAPGEQHTVRITAALGSTDLTTAGKSTQIGLKTNGESR